MHAVMDWTKRKGREDKDGEDGKLRGNGRGGERMVEMVKIKKTVKSKT